jgi:iron complex outermembrane receptor protein
MPVRWLFLVILFLGAIDLLSQQVVMDSSLYAIAELPTVEFVSTRGTDGAGLKTTFSKAKLLSLGQPDLGELLSSESGIFIKSYGLGSLATASFRGGSAGQLTVLWNGLPLENPMLGLLDLSQVDTRFFESIEVQRGSGTVGYGSGAVAGSIHLNSAGRRANSGVEVSLGAGSLNTASFNIASYFVSPDQRWTTESQLSFLSAENDLRYFNLREERWERQTNAALNRRGFQQSVSYRPDERTSLVFRVWGQQNEKEIPPTTTQRRSESSQGDDFLRASLHYEKRRDNGRFLVRSGIFRESLDFRDPQNSMRAISHFWKGLLETEWDWYLKADVRLTAGLSSQFLEGEAPAYGTAQRQLRSAPFLALSQRKKDLFWRLTLRQETVDGQFLATAPALELRWSVTKQLATTLGVNRSFRLPSMNDIFWTPGGDPALKPEAGWGQQIGLQLETGAPSFGLNASITAFHRLIDNWIQWAPHPSGSYWGARNLTRVSSYGLEPRLSSHWATGALNWTFSLGADVVRSRNLVAVELPVLRADEQLAYVPELSGNGEISVTTKAWQLRLTQQYVGSRRGNQNNSLAAFWLTDLGVGHQLGSQKSSFSIRGNIENLFNLEYRVIENRRMPGRLFRLSLRYQFNGTTWSDHN